MELYYYNYFNFLAGVFFWCLFAYSLENIRDMWTWVLLLDSLMFFALGYLNWKYPKKNNKTKSMQKRN